jgi:Spy/CpxP family protein refolding chaperone
MEGTMKKWQVTLLALFFVGLATVVLAAAPDSGPAGPAQVTGPRGHAGFHHRFASRLNLTQEQKDKMRELRNRYYTDTHDLRYDIRIKRLEMRKLFTDPKVDDATLLAKEKDLSALRLKLMDRKAEKEVGWRKILTPEQIQKLGLPPSWQRHGR